MTEIQHILDRLKKIHGDHWPAAAVDRLLVLYAKSLESDDALDEYRELRDWVVETVQAGVAYRYGRRAWR